MEEEEEEEGENGVRRWVVDISQWEPPDSEVERLAGLLPSYERPAIARFIKIDDRKRALVSRLLQYKLVNEVLSISFEKITIHRTTEGKPYLNSGSTLFPNFNFSLSHHGDYVGIASEPLCLVGLDIVSLSKSQKETTSEFINNFSSYLTNYEWDNIVCAGSSVEILAEFYRYWCLKEAFVKAIGAGLGFGFQRLEFHHSNWTNISIYIDGDESRDWKFFLFELDKKHLASVAKGHPRQAVESYRRTLLKVNVEEEEFQYAIQHEEQGFISYSVEQLILHK